MDLFFAETRVPKSFRVTVWVTHTAPSVGQCPESPGVTPARFPLCTKRDTYTQNMSACDLQRLLM